MKFKYQCNLCGAQPFMDVLGSRAHMRDAHRISPANRDKWFDTLVTKTPIPPTPEDILREIVVAGDVRSNSYVLHVGRNTLGDMSLCEAARTALEKEEDNETL